MRAGSAVALPAEVSNRVWRGSVLEFEHDGKSVPYAHALAIHLTGYELGK